MTLLERRRALMSQNKSSGILPRGYRQVEYIESTGTQWLDTEFIPNGDTRVEADFQLTKVKASFIFGSRVGSTTRTYTFNVSSSGDFVSGYNDRANAVIAKADTERHIVDKRHRTTWFDGVYCGQYEKATFECPNSLEIFACYNNGTKGYLPAEMKLYSCKIYTGVIDGILERDFIPCYRKADRVAGLYDIVNDKFYTNQGTGEFLIGGEI